jgi:hypothetical protein
MLEIITSKGYDQQISAPIDKMKKLLEKLLEEDRISPIGECFAVNHVIQKDDFHRYAEMLGNMKKWRLHRETTRTEEDAIFHYKVDCLNILLSCAVNDRIQDQCLLFATTQRENLWLCRSNEVVLGRNPCVPLFLLNSHVLHQKGFMRSLRDFFQEGLDHARGVLKRIGAATKWEDITVFDVIKIREFYEHYIHNLNHETLALQNKVESVSKEDMVRSLADEKHVRTAFAEADIALKGAVRDLSNLYHEFNDGMDELFEMADDPIVKKLMKQK